MRTGDVSSVRLYVQLPPERSYVHQGDDAWLWAGGVQHYGELWESAGYRTVIGVTPFVFYRPPTRTDRVVITQHMTAPDVHWRFLKDFLVVELEAFEAEARMEYGWLP